MKQGRTIQELAVELDRQNEVKEDIIADTGHLTMNDNGTLRIPSVSDYVHVRSHAKRQIGDRVGIPAKYFSRMEEHAPELLATNVNHWFWESPERRMIRFMDGDVRAFLSDRYLRRDNHDLMRYILPFLTDFGGLQVVSCEVTDSRLYLKVTTPRIQEEVKVGDIVQAGFVIGNSEIGLGELYVLPLVLTLSCMNGAVFNSYGMRKRHIGKRIETDSDISMLYADDTIKADDEAFFLKCRDVIKNILSEEVFSSIVAQMSDALDNTIEVKPTVAVERLAKKYELSQDESDGVLTALLQGAEVNQYGLSNAVTRASQDVADYDRCSEMEALGGDILYLTNGEWKEIAV